MVTTAVARSFYDAFYRKKPFQLTWWHKGILTCLADERVKAGKRVLEIGCGRGEVLFGLRQMGFCEELLWGLDLSETAISHTRSLLPRSHLLAASLFDDRIDEKFDYVILAEVIEHLEDLERGLDLVRAMLGEHGTLVMSFPNYYNLPWLFTRIIAERLHRPELIVLQPIDHIFTYGSIRRQLHRRGLTIERCWGSVYFPPRIRHLERAWMDRLLDRAGLGKLSFHPVLVARPRRDLATEPPPAPTSEQVGTIPPLPSAGQG